MSIDEFLEVAVFLQQLFDFVEIALKNEHGERSRVTKFIRKYERPFVTYSLFPYPYGRRENTYPKVLVFQIGFLSDHPSLRHVSITCKLHDFEDCQSKMNNLLGLWLRGYSFFVALLVCLFSLTFLTRRKLKSMERFLIEKRETKTET